MVFRNPVPTGKQKLRIKEAYLESEGSGFGGWDNQQSGIEGSVTLTTDEPVKIHSSEC